MVAMLCLDCRRVTETPGGLCAACKRTRARKRQRTRETSHYGHAWRKLRAEHIRRHLAAYGPVCPRCGLEVAPRDLTLDHVAPRSLDAGVQVLCRSCNARKGNRAE